MTKTILLADDSVTIQKVVELTFMDEDFRVSAVSNGAEAIARLSESKPDVVIDGGHLVKDWLATLPSSHRPDHVSLGWRADMAEVAMDMARLTPPGPATFCVQS